MFAGPGDQRYARGMIGRLVGQIIEKNTTGILLDVGGVGYDVVLPLSTLAGLPATGETVTLWIHTHVREDELRLFGFGKRADRTAFRTMLKISGVGPKLAVTVLGALSGDQLARVIEESDAKRLSAIPGIGKKTAERMILELGGKLNLRKDSTQTPKGEKLGDLTAALKNLGFKPTQVDRVLQELRKQELDAQPFEVLIREALALLQRK